MTINSRHFLVVKYGNPPEYNEDAAAADPARRRFAISDGATESGFARLWSRLLVDQFMRAECPPTDWQAWLPAAQQRWGEELQGVKIPYYGEEQFKQGSFATFLGVILEDIQEASCRWHASAVGDSCLFHTRGGELLQSFPLDQSAQFGRFPVLVGSRSPLAEIVDTRARSTQGEGQADDRLWLMSDALSQWCLAETEAARPPWQKLAEFLAPTKSEEQFAEWINQLRDQRGLHNDDVTLLAIDL